MASLVSRHDVRDENRRVLRIIIGVMVFLVAVSIVTIVLKHRG
ncbi:MAG TPA: hypothetical protein VJX23_04190 [Candidatus Binataceae bacterium]|nr:hypothetical protein [Candidatus Binataceae bacterium]